MTSPRVHIQTETLSRRNARVLWDTESSTLTCSIESTNDVPSAPPVLERLDALLHLRAPERRLMLGDVDMLLDEAARPTSLELYSNPARWRRVVAEPLGAINAADVSFELSYDANGIAAEDVPIAIEHDAASAALTLRFGEDATRWVCFARGMLFGVNSENRLAAIRFHPFKLNGADSLPASRA